MPNNNSMDFHSDVQDWITGLGVSRGNLLNLYGNVYDGTGLMNDSVHITTIQQNQNFVLKDNNGNKIEISGNFQDGFSIKIEGDVRITKGQQILLDL